MPGTGWTLKSYGFMMMAGFLSAVYFAMRRAMRAKTDPDEILNIAFYALVSGVIGSRIMFVWHYWDESFADAPDRFWAIINLTRGGLEFLGGVLFTIPVVVVYMWRKKLSIRLFGDFLAIMIPWALGFGRLGCFLNGCCFGGACVDAHGQPASSLAVAFPFGSPAAIRQWEEREITFPAELTYDGVGDGNSSIFGATLLGRDLVSMTPEAREKPLRQLERIEEIYRRAEKNDPESEQTKQLKAEYEATRSIAEDHANLTVPLMLATHYPSREDPTRITTMREIRDLARAHDARWVHPTQLYAAVAGLLLAIMLARVFHRRKRHGLVWGLFLLTYPPTRIFLEMIRSDNPLDAYGLTVSQAISLTMMVGGVIWLVVIYKFMPERSPILKPWYPPQEGEAQPASA